MFFIQKEWVLVAVLSTPFWLNTGRKRICDPASVDASVIQIRMMSCKYESSNSFAGNFVLRHTMSSMQDIIEIRLSRFCPR